MIRIICMIIALGIQFCFLIYGLWNPNSKVHKDPALPYLIGMMNGLIFAAGILL